MKRIFLTLAGILFGLIAAAALTFYLHPIWVADQQIHWHLRTQHVLSNYTEVDGNRIHYFEALPPHAHDNGTPIVLIHGLGARGEDWSAMIPTLAAHGFHVYAPDLLGYGRSAHPDIHYTIAEEEKLVVDFMQTVGLTRADIGGWSMGGWIALKLTADHPEMVRRLIVYDSAGIYFPATFDETLFAPTNAEGFYHLEAMLTPHPVHLPSFVIRDALRKLQSNAWIIDRSVRSMTAGRDLMDFQLYRIHAPTLVVWGAEDQLIPLTVGEALHHHLANSNLLIVQDCGHLAPSECSKPILKGTLDFLQSHPPMQSQVQTVPGH